MSGFIVEFFSTKKIPVSVNEDDNDLMGESTQKSTQKTDVRILNLLAENSKLTRKQITEIIGDISEDAVKKQLAKLKKDGRIIRIGADKGGYWVVIEK